MSLVRFALVTLLCTSIVFAIHEYSSNLIDYNGGYAGESARGSRAIDPYSRSDYFPKYTDRPLSNFGSKGPTYRITNTGQKSAFSSNFNLDTNSFISQGRNPKRISNSDPGMRGFSIFDRPVYLTPANSIDVEINGLSVSPKATARIVSQSSTRGTGNSDVGPQARVFIQAINLPLMSSDGAYEAWLFDEDTGYSLSLGLLEFNRISSTASLSFEINRDLSMFETVVISREEFPDPDPSPSVAFLIGYSDGARVLAQSSESDMQGWVR